MRRSLSPILFAALCAFFGAHPDVARAANPTPLDASLKPPEATTSEITDVFRDMVVVQRKAKEKARSILFYTYGSFDFSDGPTTMYGMNLNLGYALSDYWEVYANYVPAFIAQERDVVKRVQQFVLIDGDTASISYAKPLSQYGLELLWAPAYGKDSWGPYSIVRSDTFVKLQAGQINYEGGQSGLRYGATIGKTFFLAKWFNFRVSAGASFLEAIISQQKQMFSVGIIEAGLVWYL